MTHFSNISQTIYVIDTYLVLLTGDGRSRVVNIRRFLCGLASNGILERGRGHWQLRVHRRWRILCGGSLHDLHWHGYPQILWDKRSIKIATDEPLREILTLQGSDVWLPELGFFVWWFVVTNHGKVILKHFGCFFLYVVRCKREKILG